MTDWQPRSHCQLEMAQRVAEAVVLHLSVVIACAAVGCSDANSDPLAGMGGVAGALVVGGGVSSSGGSSGVLGSSGSPVSGAGRAAGGAGLGGNAMGGRTAGGNAAGGNAAGGDTTGGRSGNGGRNAAGGGGMGGRNAGGGSAIGGSAPTGGMSGAGGSTASCSTTPLSGGSQHCSSNTQGNVGSYAWTIWSSGSGGCITPYGVGAAFKATWSDSGDFLAREGLGLGSNKTYDKFGTFAADFAETKSGTVGGFSYIGIYGWSVSPLVEFYIVDDWFSGHPNPGGTKMGTLTADGGTYDIYKHTQTNQPAITGGNQTFDQFFSVRQTARTCGHISISEHFKQWASLGLKLGNMEEAKILVEVGGGSGNIDFTNATLTVQ